ncbi:MAG: Eco57I restriction-modification methylase domain-containing protein [Firmicutes bacterium]|nr:Eco57I restriction-modification methylase domain-containing protein [Bacillota bacterium]
MAESFFDRVAKQNAHTPDVLACLANLSNDEVFTPPEVVNQMLDMLPQELFESTETTFLDPACKTGVFLREIAKRLLEAQMPLYKERMGLISDKKSLGIELSVEDEYYIEELQSVIDHIFQKQLFGIAITELTSLLSRRSLYCSKYPDGPYSISRFENSEGNIRFKRVEHAWDNDGKCIFCGAGREQWKRSDDKETHAYEFIHPYNLEELTKMKFDVIISNPPYQLNDGGNGASAKPIYHLFVQQAKKLKPRYISMIIPARWYAGGKGLDSFRDTMLQDERISIIHDFVNAADCFSGVEIKGGVCYFLWDVSHTGASEIISHKGNEIVSKMKRKLLEPGNTTFIRYNEAIPILHKVRAKCEETFDKIVSPRKPFGLPSNFSDFEKEQDDKHELRIYAQKQQGYVSMANICKNHDWINKWKIFMPEAIGAGNMGTDLLKPIIGEPNTVCSETYVVIGPLKDNEEANNVEAYIKTQFFHFLLGLKKITQHTTSKTYSFIPMQDFSRKWSDEELFAKYGLTEDEVAFITTSVREIE